MLVRTLLVVANQTIGGADLVSAISERAGSHVHLLVPVPPTPPTAIAVGLAAAESVAITTVDLPDQREIARERLAGGLRWLRTLDVEATGEIVATDPVDDVAAAVERLAAAEVIVSTLPSRLSRWLRQDLPRKIERRVTVPVTVVQARADDGSTVGRDR